MEMVATNDDLSFKSNLLAPNCALHQRFGLELGLPNLYGLVANDLRVAVRSRNAVADGVAVHLGIVEAVNATTLPVGMHTIEQQVDGVETL